MIKTILIVDDEPAARYGLRRALESKYHIAEADSAEAALFEGETPGSSDEAQTNN